MPTSPRLAWVDTAKGLSIILVVMMYATYNSGQYTGKVGFLHYVIGFATPFRMPEFFLISGLFLGNVIDRPWRAYADRRIVHYLYFYVLWAAIMLILKVGIYDRDPTAMAEQIALAAIEPYGVLWFIYMLAVFGAVMKLLRQVNVRGSLILVSAVVLQMARLKSESYVLTQFAAYFLFFYLGYWMAPWIFRMAAWSQRHVWQASGGLLLWALGNGLLVFSTGYAVEPTMTRMGFAELPLLHLTLAIVGALALCALGALFSKMPSLAWLRWLGEHSLVIYVAFTLPMSIFRAVALKTGVITDTGFLSLAVLVVSIACPIIVYGLAQRFGVGLFLFKRPAWVHL